jgi:hypothetical protein
MVKKTVSIILAAFLLAEVASAGTFIASCRNCGGYPPVKYLVTKLYNDAGILVEFNTFPCGTCNW